MSMIPRLSIVTASFNQAHFIEATLRSVSSQRYPFFEHIVVSRRRGGSYEAVALGTRVITSEIPVNREVEHRNGALFG